jgi:hypothetical protein
MAMTKKQAHINARSPIRDFTAVVTLCILSLALVIRAFYAAGLAELTPDQRTILNYFFALLAGGVGFLFGGVVLNLTGALGPNLKLTMRALGGSALFVLLLIHPLFSFTSLPENLSAIRPMILSPGPGNMVGQVIEVHGRAGYPTWHHYVVVTGIVAGGDIVQDTHMNWSSTGDLFGTATIGNVAVGEGDPYLIRIVASRVPLTPGPLVPRKDLVFSDAVNVIRSFQGKGAD